MDPVQLPPLTVRCIQKSPRYTVSPEDPLGGVPQNYGHLTLSMVQLKNDDSYTQAWINLATINPEVYEALQKGQEYEMTITLTPKEG